VYSFGEYDGDLLAGVGVDGFHSYLRRWNGSAWSDFTPAIHDRVWAITLYDGDLVAGGDFGTVGTFGGAAKSPQSTEASHIARWDGAEWHPLIGTLSVDLASFKALADRDCITIEWTTASEIDNAGFNLYRGLKADGPNGKVNEEFIVACGDEIKGATYAIRDEDVTHGLTYYYWLEDADLHGKCTMHGPVWATPRAPIKKPKTFRLYQNSPNPFSSVTDIRYALPVACDVTLAVYDVSGHLMKTLVVGPEPAGQWMVHWDGKDGTGQKLAGGIYYCKLEAGGRTEVKKMVFLR
jgi:hypothetical protein